MAPLNLDIREMTGDDLEAVLRINREAFGQDDEADLVEKLIRDVTAAPVLSLVAAEGGEPVGHILFTRISIQGRSASELFYLLAPMAVLKSYQGKGIGGRLIRTGLGMLKDRGVQLVLVLGHPEYYPRYGFLPDAGKHGLEAPYPIPEEHKDAWMVSYLAAGSDRIYGKVSCSDTLQDPKYWEE